MIRAALDRRVPQFVGLYVLGSWGFVQFVDWAVGQFLLSPTLTSVVFVALILLLPSVVVIAWRHGAPGQDPWKAVDGVAVGANLLVMAGVLVFAFWGSDLGAATTTKVLEDPDGNVVERVVPNEDLQRSVLLFDLENRSGDSELDWLETFPRSPPSRSISSPSTSANSCLVVIPRGSISQGSPTFWRPSTRGGPA